jgi:hypothetical protein
MSKTSGRAVQRRVDRGLVSKAGLAEYARQQTGPWRSGPLGTSPGIWRVPVPRTGTAEGRGIRLLWQRNLPWPTKSVQGILPVARGDLCWAWAVQRGLGER